jgi:ubiquinone/menaquinone biosynthesis C-methylase UbiE
MSRRPAYVLGSDEVEIARLDAQAAAIAEPTALLLRAAGIAPGMRVLDLGTGLGHVARLVSELVGPTGLVVGIDESAAHLDVAERRRAADEIANVRFVEADVRDFRPDEQLDAVVGRLILFHLPDAEAVLRHHVAGLRPGGSWRRSSSTSAPRGASRPFRSRPRRSAGWRARFGTPAQTRPSAPGSR